MRRRQWITIFIGVCAFIGGAILNQLVGDVGTTFIYSVINGIITSAKISLWPWLFTLLFLITTLLFLYTTLISNRARTTATNLLELDDSMTRLFASWIPKKDHTVQIKGILHELLRDACRELGRDVQRASILLPEEGDNEYLAMWVAHGIPPETIERARFYVGTDTLKVASRGIAGKAFVKGELHVAHVTKAKGVWQCDCSGFIRFTSTDDDPAYHSFVCMPIIGPSTGSVNGSSTVCLGVLCFDSLHERIFDNSHTEEVLRAFARRITFALLMNSLLP